MTEGICCKVQSAPKFAAFESPQSASLPASLPLLALRGISLLIGGIGPLCPRGALAHTNSPQIFEKAVQSAGRTESSAPTNSVGNFELYQASREKSRKTEAVFLVGSRGSGGKSKSPRARFLLPAFSFGEAKENAGWQSQISNMGSYFDKCIVDCKTVQRSLLRPRCLCAQCGVDADELGREL